MPTDQPGELSPKPSQMLDAPTGPSSLPSAGTLGGQTSATTPPVRGQLASWAVRKWKDAIGLAERIAHLWKLLTAIFMIAASGYALWLRIPRDPKAIFVVLPGITEYSGKQERKNVEHSVARDLWEGIAKGSTSTPGQGPKLVLQGNGNNMAEIAIVPIDDGPEPEDTIARLEANSERYECVMMLAHESSTLAKSVWRKYYKEAGIPVILLGPTNPSLTEDDYSSNTRLLLRLLPNDNEQVDLLKSIVSGELQPTEQLPERAVLVVTDTGNPVYATYLASRVMQALPPRVRYLGSVEVATTSSLLQDWDRITRLAPTTILFVGMADAAQAFVLGMEAEWHAVLQRTNSGLSTGSSGENANDLRWFETVELVFTDGSASSGFCEFIANSRRSQWRSIYVTSTMPPQDAEGEAGRRLTAFNFVSTGKAAILLANYLAYDAWWARELTAKGVLVQVAKRRGGPPFPAADGVHPPPVDANLPPGLGTFKFDDRGDNIVWKWHAYRLQPRGGVFSHADGCK